MAFVRTSIADFSLPNAAYIGASVSFLQPDANGDPTSTFGTLYADLTGPGTLPNPQILDSAGKFQQPVYIEEPVVAKATIVGGETVSGVIRPSISNADVQRAVQAAGESAAHAAQSRKSANRAAQSAASLTPESQVLAIQVFTH